MTDTNITPEFSRMVSVFKLPEGGKEFTVEATAEECSALKDRFEFLSLSNLKATVLIVNKGGDNGTLLTGHLTANISQACVATAEPVTDAIDEDIRIRFVPQHVLDAVDDEEYFLDPNAEELDTLEGTDLDIGELVAQFMYMLSDPFPRAEGVDLESLVQDYAGVSANEDELKKPNPFSVLSGKLDKT